MTMMAQQAIQQNRIKCSTYSEYQLDYYVSSKSGHLERMRHDVMMQHRPWAENRHVHSHCLGSTTGHT
jgi:hypothetical protein